MVKKGREAPQPPPPRSPSSESQEDQDTSEEEEKEDNQVDNSPPSPLKLHKVGKPNVTLLKSSIQSNQENSSDAESESESETVSDSLPLPLPKLKSISEGEGSKGMKKKSRPASSSRKRPVETEKEVAVSKEPKKAKKEGGALQTKAAEKRTDGNETKKPFFSRVWTNEDEIAVLKGMIEFAEKKGEDPMLKSSYFCEFVKKSLKADLDKRKIMDKVRRLKHKYLNPTKKKRPLTVHEEKIVELSHMVWGDLKLPKNGASLKLNGGPVSADDKKKGKEKEEENSSNGGPMVDDDTMRKEESNSSDEGPITAEDQKNKKKIEEDTDTSNGDSVEKEEGNSEDGESATEASLRSSFTGTGIDAGLVEEGLKLMNRRQKTELDKRWRILKVEEIEICLKRANLVSQQSSLLLDALKSTKK